LTAHRRIIAFFSALALALQVGVSATTPGARADSAVVRSTTGGDKTSCVYTQHRISGLNDFSALVGRTFDCAVVFNDTASTWSVWDQPWFLGGNDPDLRWGSWLRAATGRSLVITQSLVPNGIESDWRTQGAAGAYDGYIRTWAANLVAGGAGSAIIRLAHEANGDWYFDNIGSSASDYAAWAAYWAHFVEVARSVPGAHFTFDWTVNAGYRRIAFDSYYPGDSVVDVVGIDQYDGIAIAPNPPPTTPAGRWNALLAQHYGLGDLIAYATAHGKPLSIPEWGLMIAGSANGTGGGDDGYYVDELAAVVQSHRVRYQGFWEKADPTSVTNLEHNPSALAAYRRHFGANGDALGTVTPTGSGGTAGGVVPPSGSGSTGGTAGPTPPATSTGPAAGAPAVSTTVVRPTVAAALSSRSAKRGRAVTLTITMTASHHAVQGARLVVQRLGRHGWASVRTITSNGKGRAVWRQKATASATYRIRFGGTANLTAATSNILRLKIHA
jgi:hypothetical protein